MEAARLRAAPSHREPGRLGVVLLLFALAALAWVVTQERMAGHDGTPGADPGALGFFAGMWAVMMAAMMFPSVWPTVLVYRRLQGARREQGLEHGIARPALMLAGYLAAWTAAGVVAYGLLKAGRALDLEMLGWAAGGHWVAGGVIVAAAAYQLTPFKDACLKHCRGPFGFFLEHWRGGALGALRMGALHGAWCIGCCWALMAAFFALGVMSLAWMAVITAIIAGEKLLPWRRMATTAVAALLLVLGVGVALAPERVPALTVPDGSMDHHAHADER